MQLWHEHSVGGRPMGAESGPAEFSITLEEVRQGLPVLSEGYIPLDIITDRGVIEARFFPSPGASHAAMWVGGAGGGFDSPASGLYDRLSQKLQNEDVASLRLRYRRPADLDESVLDALAGVTLLRTLDLGRVALIGHSFGGAVALQTAVLADAVVTVVTLASQSFGTELVRHLGARPALLIHGADDDVLSAHASQGIAGRIRGPKELVLVPGAGHFLDEAAGEVERRVHDWILTNLRAGVA